MTFQFSIFNNAILALLKIQVNKMTRRRLGILNTGMNLFCLIVLGPRATANNIKYVFAGDSRMARTVEHFQTLTPRCYMSKEGNRCAYDIMA